MRRFPVIISAFICLLSISAGAQIRLLTDTPRTICSFNCSNNYTDLAVNCASRMSIRSFAYATPARVSPYELFDQLVKTLRLDIHNDFDMNFVFTQCTDVCSAAASIERNEQVIYFNATYLDQLQGPSDAIKWAIYAIFAHEIGHQLMGHTRLNYNGMTKRQRRVNELRADYFSGFVLQSMSGATLERALAGVKSITDLSSLPDDDDAENYSLYPTLAHRKEAVATGFRRNLNDTATIRMFHDIAQAASDRNEHIIMNMLMRNMYAGNVNKGRLDVIDFANRNPGVSKALVANLTGITYAVQMKFDLANIKFKDAIKLDGKMPEYYWNAILVERNQNTKEKLAEKANALH